MRPAKFEYHQSHTIGEALGLLQSCGDGAKVLAGGLSLVPTMRLRLAEPKHVIDITRIPSLSYVVEDGNGGLSIGALTTYAILATSRLVQAKCPVLAEVAAIIGDQQVRNRGTIGGNLCHADPASDIAPVILALNGELKAVSQKGERVIKASDFFVDLFTTPLGPTELLIEIRIPPTPARTGSSYVKLNQRKGDYAIVSAAALITIDGKNVCKTARIGLGAVASTPVRAHETEKVLTGNALTDELVEKASDTASAGIQPGSDVHASAEYRTEMIKVITKRALKEAIKRAR